MEVEMAEYLQISFLVDFWMERLIGWIFPPFSRSSGNFHLLVGEVEMVEYLQISFFMDFWMEVLFRWIFHLLVGKVEMAYKFKNSNKIEETMS
jgi:hypothetical protein